MLLHGRRDEGKVKGERGYYSPSSSFSGGSESHDEEGFAVIALKDRDSGGRDGVQ